MQSEKLKITRPDFANTPNLRFLIVLFNFAFLLLNFNLNSAYAAETDWIVHVKVSMPDSRSTDGMLWNHLIAGVREGATDGYDSSSDTLSLVETDDPLQALFNHGVIPENENNDGMIDKWTCTDPEEGYTPYTCSLWRDIRSFGYEKVWQFSILSTLNGGTIALDWSFDYEPEDMEIILVDLSATANPVDMPVDMKAESFYTYTNNFDYGKKYGLRSFEIRMKATGLFIRPPLLHDATVDTPYNSKFSAAIGAPVWSLEHGDLPPGISVNSYTGEITGIPVSTGLYYFVIRGDDPGTGFSRSKEYTLNVHAMPSIDAASLPVGVAGTDYAGEIPVSGGSVPVKWGIKGNLPEGVTLNSATGVLSGKLFVPGIYDFTVKITDANGAAALKDFRITVVEPEDEVPPLAILDLRGVYLTGTSLLLLWFSPADDSMTGTAALYDLRYLGNCTDSGGLNEETWSNAIEANGEPRPQAGAFQTYTLTGLEPGKLYCIAIKSLDASGHVSGISNIVTVPLSSAQGLSGFSELSSTLTLRMGYNLISIPLIPVPNGKDSLFGASLGNPVSFYRWYSAYPGITIPQYYMEDVVMPGLGYFLYSPEDNITLDIGGLKIEEGEYRVGLQKGWNMVGNPYTKTIILRDILVLNNITKEIRFYTDAVKAGWIGNAIYPLVSNNYDFASFNDEPPAALDPWVGYWIYAGAENGVEIIFRRP